MQNEEPGDLEGEFVLGWPQKKRLKRMASADAEGRITYGQSPILEQEGLITPADATYIVAQMQMPEPTHPDDWEVEVGGEVDKPFTLNLEELKQFPARTVRAVTECAGNDGDFFEYLAKRLDKKPSMRKSTEDLSDWYAMHKGKDGSIEDALASPRVTNLCSGGEWTGTPLRNVLEAAGIKSNAVSVRAEGWDCARPDPMRFYRAMGTTDVEVPDPGEINFDKALPMEKALHEDTIITCAHNGDALMHVHGAPARLIVPGWAGNWWVKWLQNIEVHDHMAPCYHQTEYFVYGKSHDDPDKKMMTSLGCKSIITWPRDNDGPIKVGSHAIRGLAWSGEGEITRIEISLDGGQRWQDAHLEYSPDRWLWKRWSHRWVEDQPGKYSIMVRAHDEAGRVQPATDWNYQLKHFDGIVPTDIDVIA